MTYRELSKLYHMDASSNRDANLNEERQRRLNGISTYRLGIESHSSELFIAVPPEMLVLMEKILRMERRLSNETNALPPLAQAALIRGLILDEVVSTNAIEEIHSTRQQIEEALEAPSSNTASLRRFKELAQVYLALSKDEVNLPQTPQDIRSLYDSIMKGELKQGQFPDGDIFRAQGVNITQGGVKVIHHGVEPEAKIIDYMQKMIALTKRDDMPRILSAIASHYLFEYVHPFYDGNGRTGRYLLALFLSELLSAPTVFSLSRTISENKGAYYAAFSSAENPLNKGELTFFVLQMLELVSIAQGSTLERLLGNKQKFEDVKRRCAALFEERNLAKHEREIIFALVQFELFGTNPSLSQDDLAEYTGLEWQTARKYAGNLEEGGLIRKTKKRPLWFTLSDLAREILGIEKESD